MSENIKKNNRINNNAVLDVKDLTTIFRLRSQTIHAVNNVSFSVKPGELLGVVGESGSGKSVTMMSLMKLLPMPPAEITSGTAIFEGKDLLQLSLDELRAIRGGEVGFIFQDPMTSLNPVFTVGSQLMEPLKIHFGLAGRDARKRARELLELVGIPSPDTRLDEYPHQFSGGMRQRVMIAMALACDPKVLIADEPTTALDVTIQAQILELVKRLRKELGMAIIWITHDLGVVAGIAERVMVMYAGEVVEQAPVGELFANPRHPYTAMLLETLPNIEGNQGTRLQTISGQPPLMVEKPMACSFRDRCPKAMGICSKKNPSLVEMSNDHLVSCWLAGDSSVVSRVEAN